MYFMGFFHVFFPYHLFLRRINLIYLTHRVRYCKTVFRNCLTDSSSFVAAGFGFSNFKSNVSQFERSYNTFTMIFIYYEPYRISNNAPWHDSSLMLAYEVEERAVTGVSSGCCSHHITVVRPSSIITTRHA